MTRKRISRLLTVGGLACLAFGCEPPDEDPVYGPLGEEEPAVTGEATAGTGELGAPRPDGRRPRGDQPPPPDDGADQPPPPDDGANPPPPPPPDEPVAEEPADEPVGEPADEPAPPPPPPEEEPPPPPPPPPEDDGPAPPPDPADFVVPAPANNPTTDAKVELGRLLFWDPILSGNRDVACATCHHPDFGYADALPLSRGVGGVGLGPDRRGGALADRNAPTVLLTGLNGWVNPGRLPDPVTAPMFWDIRARSLEAQALGPIANAAEMRGNAYPAEDAVDVVVSRLAGIPAYVQRFTDAFDLAPGEAITGQHLAQAIAAFERSLSTPSSAFDRWLDGDDSALTAQQERGLAAFRASNCDACHLGPMFSDYRLHRLGTPDNRALPAPDTGDGAFRFRTPTLRNVARTGPYMHGGTIRTLPDVLAFYRARAGGGGPGAPPPPPGAGPLDPLLGQVRLNPQAERDIIAFLQALNDETPDNREPNAVPSGLPVGGRL